MSEKKYYWLKLKENFFDRKDVKIMEGMENGKDYIIFLLKLKLRSLEDEGYLRVSKAIPYDEEMLSTITNTNIDIVRSALKVFVEFGLIEILENKTIYMACIEQLIGSESSSAERVRRFRAKKEELTLHGNNNVMDKKQNSNTELELDTDKEIDKELKNKKVFGIFNHWNSLEIIKHKKITSKIEKAIKSSLKNYSEEEIKDAMNKYKTVIADKIYYFCYEWSLENFLKREKGMPEFTPAGEKWLNYKASGSKGADTRTGEKIIEDLDYKNVKHEETE